MKRVMNWSAWGCVMHCPFGTGPGGQAGVRPGDGPGPGARPGPGAGAGAGAGAAAGPGPGPGAGAGAGDPPPEPPLLPPPDPHDPPDEPHDEGAAATVVAATRRGARVVNFMMPNERMNELEKE